MPDDRNLFDDDDMTPDWLRNASSGSGQSDDWLSSFASSESDASSADSESPAASYGVVPAISPPWETHHGDDLPAPNPLTVTPPPWELHEGGAPPAEQAARGNPPWEKGSSFPQVDAGPEVPRLPTADLPSWEDEFPEIDYNERLNFGTAPVVSPDETSVWQEEQRLRGYTDDLSFPEDVSEAEKPAPHPDIETRAGLPTGRLRMSDLAEEFEEDSPDEPSRPVKPQTSLLDRLAASASSQPESPTAAEAEPASTRDQPVPDSADDPLQSAFPVPAEDVDAWMSAFGEAAQMDTSPPDTDGDVDWLDGFNAPGTDSEAGPEVPEDETNDDAWLAGGLLAEQPDDRAEDADDSVAPEDAFADESDLEADSEGESGAEPESEVDGLPVVPPLAFPVEETDEDVDFSWLDEPVASAPQADVEARHTDERSSEPALPEPELDDLTGLFDAESDLEAEADPVLDKGDVPDDDHFAFTGVPAALSDSDSDQDGYSEHDEYNVHAGAGDAGDAGGSSSGHGGDDGEPPAWLRAGLAADDDEPEDEPEPEIDEKDVPDWVRPVVEPPRSLRRLGPSAEVSDDGTPLTYEEWEAQELERELEAQKTEADRMLEEVPDWFDKIEQGAVPAKAEDDAESQGEGPEFVPGWFLGLEDQDEEEAPDWFKKVDYSADAVTRSPEMPAVPAPAEASEEDLPDWFKGVDLPGGMAGELPAAGEPAMAAPEDIPFPDLDLDDEMPGGDFIERFEPLPSVTGTGTLVPPDPDAPDWLTTMDADSPAESGAKLPADLFNREPAQAEMGAPEVSLDADNLDWLNEISPEDVDEPPSEPVAMPQEFADEGESAALDEDELDSGDIDRLLGLYEPSAEEALATAAAEADSYAAVPEGWDTAEASLGVADSPVMEEIGGVFMPQELDLPDEAPDGDALAGTPQDAEDLFAALERELSTIPTENDEAGAEDTEADAPALAQGDQPEWVGELRPDDLPVTLRAGGAEAEIRQRKIKDLPERLRRFREISHGETDITIEPAPAPESGPLAGIVGALPLLEVLQPEARSAAGQGPVVTRQQQTRVDRLQALLDAAVVDDEPEEESFGLGIDGTLPDASGEVVAAPVRRARRKARFKFDRLVVTLVLFAALVVPFVTDAVHFGDDPAALTGDRAVVADTVESLVTGDYVLVAFEYGPSAAGELDPLVEAVLRHVLVEGAIPLAISTNPSGALHADYVMATLASDEALLAARGLGEDTLISGEDYVVLRYLPGEMVGVRTLRHTYGDDDAGIHPAFKTDLRGEETTLPIINVAQDIALIVVTGESTEDIRTWAEQLDGVAVDKVALTTASTEPMVSAYVRDDGYGGYLAGLRDSYSYNVSRNATSRAPYEMPDDLALDLPDPETSRWHSMALGAAVAAAIITLGMVVNLFRNVLRRRQR